MFSVLLRVRFLLEIFSASDAVLINGQVVVLNLLPQINDYSDQRFRDRL
jgi:hypothetical protein